MIERRFLVIWRVLESRSSHGVIFVSHDLDIGAAIDDLLITWAASDAEEWQNQAGAFTQRVKMVFFAPCLNSSLYLPNF